MDCIFGRCKKSKEDDFNDFKKIVEHFEKERQKEKK
jgi:hypothetical protein